MQYDRHRIRAVVALALFFSAGITAAILLAGNALAKETVLYNFQGVPDGAQPWSALITDKHGDLFGTTNIGGTGSCSNGCGTVFELSPRGKDAWGEAVLYSFQGESDGAYPNAALVMDPQGNLYGVTEQGGTADCSDRGFTGCGTVFELSPQGNNKWSESVLHDFQGVSNGKSDASWPNSLVFGQSGQIYGTAYNGGTCPPLDDPCFGAIFELAKHNGTWHEKIIYSADVSTNGPAGVAPDPRGNLYSVASFGGPENVGEVFMLTPPSGKGAWTASPLYDFENQSDGALPVQGLAVDAAGDLFGASSGSDSVNGNIFELTPAENGMWTESVLISFNGNNGYSPSQGPIRDSEGNLLGVTALGGKAGYGIAYRLSPENGAWTEKVLHSFANGADGSEPLGGLMIGKDGAYYGTTAGGGSTTCNGGCGTVFRIAP